MASVGGDQGDSIALNIMPMLDVFSILILFLLMNFSTDPMNHDVSKSVELPESIVSESLDEVPTITISKTELLINDHKVAPIIDGSIDHKFLSQGGVLPIFDELKKMAEANHRASKDQSKANILTLEVDKNQKMGLVKRIMFSAEQVGFIRFKLMVSKQI
jgi:biopolymer transport protein ExbD